MEVLVPEVWGKAGSGGWATGMGVSHQGECLEVLARPSGLR